MMLTTKSIHGFKQSGYQWNKKIDNKLQEIGYKSLIDDNFIDLKNQNGTNSLITAYVNDLIVATINQIKFMKLKLHLQQNFKIRDLEEPSLAKGLEVAQDLK